MDQPILYPLLLESALHTRVWGGRRLGTVMGKTLPTDEPYGESWDMHDSAVIANGLLAGQRLGDLLKIYGAQLIGPGFDPADGIPLLVKILDAAQWLSVQVHPNDEQARELEGDPRGKTEAWIILAAEPGATLITGLQAGTTRETMAEAIRSGTLEQHLVYTPVTAGDVFFVAANTVHALGPGIMIYEIQQNSDVTYRLYDWNRLGLDGKPRQLHIEKGVQVSNLASLPSLMHPVGDEIEMVTCPYFRTTRYTLMDDTRTIATLGTFHALTCIEGMVTITYDETTIALERGHSAFIPAALEAYVMVGSGVVLLSAPH